MVLKRSRLDRDRQELLELSDLTFAVGLAYLPSSCIARLLLLR